MTIAQGNVLSVLAGARLPVSALWVAGRLGGKENHGPVTHTLDALFRRSLATVTEQGWVLTDRGRRKAEALA